MPALPESRGEGMIISYSNDGKLTLENNLRSMKLNQAEIKELKEFLSTIMLVEEYERVKTVNRKRIEQDERIKTLIALINSGESKSMSLRSIADTCGWKHPQSVKYAMEKLK
jgi:hypothetical protein